MVLVCLKFWVKPKTKQFKKLTPPRVIGGGVYFAGMKNLTIILLLFGLYSCSESDPEQDQNQPPEDQSINADPEEAHVPGPNEFVMEEGDTSYIMKQYYLVLLNRGPNRDQDSLEATQIQEGHMANINRLAEVGKILVAGPMGDDTDLRGIFIFDCETQAEVDSLLQTDPAIAAGRLVGEVHPWWTAKGTCIE